MEMQLFDEMIDTTELNGESLRSTGCLLDLGIP